MPSQVALSSVFKLALKPLYSTFNYLYLFERIFQVVGKDDFLVPFLPCVFMLHFIGSISKKKKARGVIIVGSGSENVHFIFYWKEMIGNFVTNYWLDLDFRRRKKIWLCGHWKVSQNLLWGMKSETFCSLNFLKSCIHPLCMYYRTFLEWFLIAFLQIKYLWSCFY